ncbi:basic proline-rich protein-like [Dasypus novemcinctus]|uniref:basic proline-rich protein-like n=1 Tax=Dasypus novemcinctus TaxID=9361 RepID=UPI0039C9A796
MGPGPAGLLSVRACVRACACVPASRAPDRVPLVGTGLPTALAEGERAPPAFPLPEGPRGSGRLVGLKSPLRAAAPPAASRQPPAPAPPGPAPPPEAEGGRLRADRSARRRRRRRPPFRPAPGLGPHLPRTPLAPGSPAARLPTRHRPRPRPRAHGAARAPPTAQSPDGAPPTPHRHAHPRGLPGRPPTLPQRPAAGASAGASCRPPGPASPPGAGAPRSACHPAHPAPLSRYWYRPGPGGGAGPRPGLPPTRPLVSGPRPPAPHPHPHPARLSPNPPRSSDPGPWAAAAGPRVQTSCSRPRAPGSALGRRGPPPGATPTRRAGVAPHAARPSGHTAAPCAAAAALLRSVGHEPPVGCGRPRWLQTLTQEPGGERQRLLTAEVAQLPQVRLAGGEGDTAARSARPSTRRLGACRPPAGGTLATRAARPVGDISLGRPLPSVLRLARPGLGTPARRQ